MKKYNRFYQLIIKPIMDVISSVVEKSKQLFCRHLDNRKIGERDYIAYNYKNEPVRHIEQVTVQCKKCGHIKSLLTITPIEKQ